MIRNQHKSIDLFEGIRNAIAPPKSAFLPHVAYNTSRNRPYGPVRRVFFFRGCSWGDGVDSMRKRMDDVCPAPGGGISGEIASLVPGIFPGSVYRCQDPDQAERLLAGGEAGYVYQRDGHPNADRLSEKLRLLHGAQWAVLTSSGMSALAAATLTLLEAGQHVLVSEQLYGRSSQLLARHWPRLGVEATIVDTLDVDAVRRALRPETRLVVVETLTNPMLRVAPLPELAEAVHAGGAELLVDNTFASPYLCQPLQFGADWVMESVTKMINGHSDVMLGLLCGQADQLAAVRDVVSVWGLTSSPFDCWLASRGVATLHLRMERACHNARVVAEWLERQPQVARLSYPGLASHPDAARVRSLLLPGAGGSILTFELRGGRDAVRRLIAACPDIPFCPSLGEVSTTLSHPASTSHRSLSVQQRNHLGISEGTIRLSVGVESAESIVAALRDGFEVAVSG